MPDLTVNLAEEVIPELAAVLRDRYASMLPVDIQLTDSEVLCNVMLYWLRQELILNREVSVQKREDAKVELVRRAREEAIRLARELAQGLIELDWQKRGRP